MKADIKAISFTGILFINNSAFIIRNGIISDVLLLIENTAVV